MTEKTMTKEERMKALALTMPTWDDFIVDEYKKNPELAKLAIADELAEYAETGEIKYLLSTLKDVATAKGMVNLAKEAGLGRATLYEVFKGSNPRVSTLSKILRALGFKMFFVAVDNNTQAMPTPTRQKRATTKMKKQEKHLQHV